jgi:two-component system, chemotaxis family, sensor kinase CheA
MSISSKQLEVFESILNKIATEMVLAQMGSNEGMVPLYSLLNDLGDAVVENPVLVESVANVKAVLDRLLDNAGVFDNPTIDYLSEFSGWAQAAVYALKGGQGISVFGKLNEEARTAVAAGKPAAGATGFEDEVAEVAKTTDVLLEVKSGDDQELLSEFRTEANDHLEQIEASVLVLERNPKDADSMAALFRSFHTIKGVAGFLHLVPIYRLAHEVESLLDLARNGKLTLDSGMITLVLQSRDTVSKLVGQIAAALDSGKAPTEVIPVSHLIVQVKRAAQAGLRGESTSAPVAAAPAKVATAAAPAVPSVASTLPPLAVIKSNGAPVDPKAEAKKEQAQASESATIRVSTSKLDNLMDMVGELVIVQSQLSESAKREGQQQGTDNAALQRNMAQLMRITKELQRNSMALRMIPIKQTFQKTGRLVRDLASSFGKKVDFVTVGEDTELDRNVVEQIGDPLVHMVRNSLDHGLEASAADRIAAGKPEVGTIALKAYHMGSNIVIELSDDGRGLNTSKILAKAVERGLVKPEQQLSEAEMYQLIFLPGFSTADKITEVSGRGVGMDVVKKNIEKLRGAIEIESKLGKGTTFKIKLPLTMAIIDGLVVRVGEDKFILPTTSVKVAMRPTPSQISTIKGQAEILVLRGKTIPIIHLADFFKITSRAKATHEGILVIIETFGRPYAMLVDEMVSKQEVVIKSLGSLLQGLPGIAGGAILGDGTISLILDPSSIFSSAL